MSTQKPVDLSSLASVWAEDNGDLFLEMSSKIFVRESFENLHIAKAVMAKKRVDMNAIITEEIDESVRLRFC